MLINYTLIIKQPKMSQMYRNYDQSPQDIGVCNHGFSSSSNKKQYHCQKCKLWQQDHLIEEVKFVPQGYISNKKSKKDMQYQRKINNSLKQFVQKWSTKQHFDRESQLRQKVIKMKKAQPYTKGSRQCAAVVVYFAFQDQIKASFKEYCKRNNLNVKLFNNKLKMYTKMFMKDPLLKEIQYNLEHNYSNIKVEERHQEYNAVNPNSKQEQESPFGRLYPEYPSNLNEKSIIKNEQNIRKALETIYNDIFKGYYYKSKKSIILKRITDRIMRTSQELLKAHRFQQDQPATYYYLIYGILKSYSFKIYFFKYSEIIKNRTGYSLNKKRAEQAKMMYLELENKDEYPFENSQMSLSFWERSVEENGWSQQPLEQFQLVQSGPMVLQEQYFSFQNYYCFLKSGNSSEIK